MIPMHNSFQQRFVDNANTQTPIEDDLCSYDVPSAIQPLSLRISSNICSDRSICRQIGQWCSVCSYDSAINRSLQRLFKRAPIRHWTHTAWCTNPPCWVQLWVQNIRSWARTSNYKLCRAWNVLQISSQRFGSFMVDSWSFAD